LASDFLLFDVSMVAVVAAGFVPFFVLVAAAVWLGLLFCFAVFCSLLC